LKDLYLVAQNEHSNIRSQARSAFKSQCENAVQADLHKVQATQC